MQIYKVGGCVRDHVMGIASNDIDYVVVGSSVEEMFSLGYNQVGKDFPVFLDKNNQEYALARRERKIDSGYTGFEFDTESVTLEEDCVRRDLTINSMAMDSKDNIIDFFGGVKDIENKILRHTSEYFIEDPVRVLRIARFRARFGEEWKVAQETKELIHKMVRKGVLGELQKDRVWKEMSRALMEPHAYLFFQTLYEVDALHVIFPDIYRLLSATEAIQWHPEKNAFEHTMLVIKQASKKKLDLTGMFCALTHDIGKGLTPLDKLPRHYGHDVNGAIYLKEVFCDKYAVPSNIKKIAIFVARHHMKCHNFTALNAKTIVNVFDSCRGDEYTIDTLYNIGVCDERGRLGSENNDVSQLGVILKLLYVWKSVSFHDFPELDGCKNGEKIKQTIRNARSKKIAEAKKNLLTP